MAVIDVTRMWSKNGGSFESQKSDPFDIQYSFTEGYQVLTDPDENELSVIMATGVPRHGQRHRTNLDAFVTKVVPVQVSPILWAVSVGYDGFPIESASVDVEWGDVTTTEPIDRDWSGKAIVTANNEQVDGLSVDINDQIVVIKRRFATLNPYAIRQYRRATNSDAFLGWPPGTARLVGFSARNQFKFGAPVEAWDVTARIQFREPFAGTTAAQAWYKRWRHEGLLVKSGTNIRRATDSFLQEETKPVLLKTDGTRETDPDAAVFIHSQVYDSLPYSALGLI